MNILSKFAACFFLVGLTLAKAQDNQVEAFPVIEFETPVYQFGTVQQGEEIRYDFKFFNRGNQVLKIKSVRPGCGCTTAGEFSKSIEPGRSGIIPIKLSTTRFKGPLSKSVTVTSNDPKHPTSFLQIKGKVWMPVVVDPQVAAFPALKSLTGEKTSIIKVTSQVETQMQIKNLRVEGERFKAVLKTITEGKEYQIEITTVPPLVYGSNRGTIRFETNIPDARNHQISATAYVMAPVQVVPNRILLKEGVLAKPMKKYLTVLSYQDTPLELSDVKMSVEGVKIDTNILNNGKHHRMTLTFPAGLNVDELKDAKLTLKTNHEEFSNFEVPVGSYRKLKK
ncbi:DUF1573 domain-containing protein [Verrucomicrobia bacterium]|nr:DUF1573 domain-containing protein [Verrucomicrobiota bacterium]